MGDLIFLFLLLSNHHHHLTSVENIHTMPRICTECGLVFANKNLHDPHWKKCVKTAKFVAYNGQKITVTRHENGTFLCYCSHHKCPKDQGFATIDAMQKHMKNLKTNWLGPEKVSSDYVSNSLLISKPPAFGFSCCCRKQQCPGTGFLAQKIALFYALFAHHMAL